MIPESKYKCRLCGRVLDTPTSCCGQRAAPADEVHAEAAMEPWVCPVCGAQSDTPVTCCGKKAVPNPEFRR
jgi:hypothetical protein